MNKTVIIAEIGECFNGDMGTAKRMISMAKNADCDIVKFQTLDYENISEDDHEKEWFKKIALDPEKIEILVGYAGEMDIQILFTPENVKTSQWLLDANLKSVKIASNCIYDLELINFINRHFEQVFMSTGMASLDEVYAAVNHLTNIPDLYLMHCISECPTGPLLEKRGLKPLSVGDIRLNMMLMLKSLFPDYKVGYSDHTVKIMPPVIAVAMGAEVIEKHITLDRKTPLSNYETGGEYLGTDHVLSLEPGELNEMVRLIREIEIIKGDWKWERSEGEEILLKFLRKRFRN